MVELSTIKDPLQERFFKLLGTEFKNYPNVRRTIVEYNYLKYKAAIGVGDPEAQIILQVHPEFANGHLENGLFVSNQNNNG